MLKSDERGAPGQASADGLDQHQIALLDAAIIGLNILLYILGHCF